VSPAGEVKLLDFGIAKLLATDDTTSGTPVTRTGLRPMTPEYAAPEQVSGARITTATDVYALGVLLFELLTGLRPTGSGDGAASPAPTAGAVRPSTVVEQRLGAAGAEDVPTPDPAARAQARSTTPLRLRRQLAGDLDTIVSMALREEPARRYASAGQLSEDIERALAGLPVRAVRDTAAYRLRRFVGRHRVGVGLAAAALIALVGFLAFSLQQSRALARERDTARAERDRADRVVGLLVGLFESASPAVFPRGDRLTLGEFMPQAERRVLQQLEGQPDLEARMRFVLGRVARARNRFAEARVHLEGALATRTELAGPDDLETLDIAVALGETLVQMGRQDQAQPLLRDAYGRLRERRDERTAEAAVVLANALGQTPEAERLLREALALRRASTPLAEAALGRSLINLGNFLVLTDRLDEGIPLLEEALARVDTPARRADPQLLMALNDLAQARMRRDDLAEAERLHRRALDVAPSIVEPESLPIANALNNLGNVLATRGRHAEAEAALRQSFAMHERLFGNPHGRTANVARNLGIVLGLQQRYDEAHEWIGRAIALLSQAGAAGQGTAWMRAQRAAMTAHRGQLEVALQEATQAVADLGAPVEGVLAAHLAECQLVLGGLLVTAARPAEAVGPLEAALAYFSAANAAPKPKVAWVQVEIGRALAAQGRCDEARPHLAALDVYAAWGLAAPGLVAEARRAQARCDSRQ
jgi:serine/threonine-protein kinase